MALQDGTKAKLSGSTDGLGILVTGTATGSSVTIHTAVASTDADTWDEIWLDCYNVHSSNVVLTLEWGEATTPMTITIPNGQGRFQLIAGNILQNAKVVKAFAATGSVIIIHGWVNKIFPQP